MAINTNLYSDFKPYQFHKIAQNSKSEKKNIQKTINLKALIGAATGAGLSYATLYTKNKRADLSEFQTGARMILMCLASNLGGVLGGSIGEDKSKIKKKFKEGSFQMMNMALPMVLVTCFQAMCNRIKPMQKLPIKIIGSFASMITGAYLATKITNMTKGEGEKNRKYTIKDATANFDDIVATIAIGFPKVAEKIPVNQIIPFIYTYNGTRAGMAE